MKAVVSAVLGGLAIGALVLLAPAPAAQEPAPSRSVGFEGPSRAPQLALYGGYYGVLDSDKTSLLGVEYRWRPTRWWDVRPIAGLRYMEENNTYAFLGLRKDFRLWGELEASPNWGVGLYEHGSVDLGHMLEFRSGMDLTYPLSDRLRIGLGFYHLSNASISDRNPGSESLVLSLSWDL